MPQSLRPSPVHRRRFLLSSGIGLVLLTLILWVSWHRAPTPANTPDTGKIIAPPPQGPTGPETAAASTPCSGDCNNPWHEEAHKPLPKPDASRGELDQAVANFDLWLNAHLQGTSPKGDPLALAQTRRAALKQLIQIDPEAALRAALPADLAQRLPASLQPFIEKRIDAFAQLEVVMLCDKTGGSLQRHLRIGDTRYQAFTYGARLGSLSKERIAAHGIAVDEMLALSSTPFRQLSPNATTQAQNPTGPSLRVAIGDSYRDFASPEDLLLYEQLSLAKEAAPSPTLDPSNPTDTGPTVAEATDSWINGSKRILWILVDHQDLSGSPDFLTSPSACTQEASSYFQRVSRGKTSFVATVIPQVLRSTYTAAALESSSASFLDLKDDALALAKNYDAANGGTGLYNPDNYDRWVILFPRINSYDWIGRAYVGGKGMWLMSGAKAADFAHELGHNQGLYHSHAWYPAGSNPLNEGTHEEYGDHFDVMGKAMGLSAGDLNSKQKSLLNYLAPNEVQTVSTTGTYRLQASDHPSATGVQALRLKTSGSEDYWVETRRQTIDLNMEGLYNFPSLQTHLEEGVLVHWGTKPAKASGDGTYLLYSKPVTNSKWLDSILGVNESLVNAANGFTITPVGKGGSGAESYTDVRIVFGATGSNRNPVLSLSGVQAEVQARTDYSFSAEATDLDGDTLYYRWDLGNGSPPVYTRNLTARWSRAGTFTLTCTVVDGRGGLAKVSSSVVVKDPLQTWIVRASESEYDAYISSFSQGNGRIVAAGRRRDRDILTSGDGVSWAKLRSLPQALSINASLFSHGRHILAGSTYSELQSTYILSSVEGDLWRVDAQIPNQGAVTSLASSGTRTVAVTGKGLILCTSNGLDWSTASSGTGGNPLRWVSYEQGLFVAVGDLGTLKTSPDGLVWTTRPLATTTQLIAATHAAGNWLVYGAGPNGGIWTSSDGSTWNKVKDKAPGETIKSILRLPDGRLLASLGTTGLAYSQNGVDWEAIGKLAQYGGLPAGALAMAHGNLLASSTDLTILQGIAQPVLVQPNWTAPLPERTWMQPGSTQDLKTQVTGYSRVQLLANGVVVAESTEQSPSFSWTPSGEGVVNLILRGFTASGEAVLSPTMICVISNDQPSKPLVIGTANSQFRSLAHSPIGFVALSYNTAAFSSDGDTWFELPTRGLGTNTEGLVHFKDRFVAYDDSSGTKLWSSKDAVSWDFLFQLPGASQIKGVATNGSVLLAVTTTGHLWSSVDGETWSSTLLTPNIALNDIDHGAGLFVITADNGILHTSPDGTTWTQRSCTPGVALESVAYHNSGWSVCTRDLCLRSKDLLSWSSSLFPSPTTSARKLTKGGGTFTYELSASTYVLIATADGAHWFQVSGAAGSGERLHSRNMAAANGVKLLITTGGGILRLGTPERRAPEILNALDLAVQGLDSTTVVEADASDFERVELLVDGTLVATSTLDNPSLSWSSVLPGSHQLQLRAFLPDGSSLLSTPVSITKAPVGWKMISPRVGGAPPSAMAKHKGYWYMLQEGRHLLRSPDAITWSQVRSFPTWVSGMDSDGSILRVAGAHQWMSNDGLAWSRARQSTRTPIKRLKYAEGAWIAITERDLLRSQDGTTWTSVASYPPTMGMEYGQGRWMVLADSAYAISSSDGVMWSKGYHYESLTTWSLLPGRVLLFTAQGDVLDYPLQSFPSTYTEKRKLPAVFTTVVNHGGTLIACTAGGVLYTSTDGITWSARELTLKPAPTKIYTDGAHLFGFGANGEYFHGTSAASFEAVNYTPRATVMALASDGINTVFSTGLVDASLGTNFTGNLHRLLPDGTWQGIPCSFEVLDVAHGRGLWIAVGNAGHVLRSTDGANWQEIPLPSPAALHCVSIGANKILAGSSGGLVYSSEDGLTWTRQQTTFIGTARKIIQGDAGCVLLTDDYGAYVSSDALTWSKAALPEGTRITGGAYSKQLGFLLIGWSGSSGGLFSSVDGLQWQVQRPTTQLSCTDLVAVPHGFAGAAPGLTFFGSNTNNWTSSWGPVTESPRFAYDGSSLWCFGYKGAIWKAPYASQASPGTTPATAGPSEPTRLGEALSLSASHTASGEVYYQWLHDGIPIPGANSLHLSVPKARITDEGDYCLEIYTRTGVTRSTIKAVNILWSRLVNLSVRSVTRSRQQPLIMGFISTDGPKSLLMRSWGPLLKGFGVAGTIEDPTLELHADIAAGGAVLASNDDWAAEGFYKILDLQPKLGAHPFNNSYAKDSALLRTVSGLHTLYASDKLGRSGVTLVELFDANHTDEGRLVNASARNYVGTGDDILVLGFVVTGTKPLRLLVRGVGPTLGMPPFNLPGVVDDPLIKLYRIENSIPSLLRTNDDWAGEGVASLRAAFSTTWAFNLPDETSKDAAMVVELQPGVYTVELHSKSGQPGEALIELYEYEP